MENARLVVRGDFTVVLWEWDATLTAQAETLELWSGARPSSNDPIGAPESEAVIQEHREVFLHAADAVLNVPITEGDILYLHDADMAVAGGILLEHATGSFTASGSLVEVQDSSLYVRGELDVGVQGAPDGVTLSLDGVVQQVEVDGQSVAGIGVQPTRSQVPLVWLASAAVLVVVAVAWHLWRRPLVAYATQKAMGSDLGSVAPLDGRQRRGAGYWLLAEKANVEKRNGRCYLLARRATDLFPELPEAQLLRAIATAHVGRDDAARVEAEAAFPLLPSLHRRGMAAWTAARCCARLGRKSEFRSWVERGIAVAPDLMRERLNGPTCQGFKGEAWFESLRARAASRCLRDDPAVH